MSKMWRIAVSSRRRLIWQHGRRSPQPKTFLQHRQYSATRHQASNEWSYNPDTGIVSKTNNSAEDPVFQSVIGMEIHAQLAIPTKLFSSAPTTHGGNCNEQVSMEPNSAVWPLDVAVPGVLPRISSEAVKYAVLTAAACNCEIPFVSRFERKHYAYADLPLGYQVTQQRWPLAANGALTCRRIRKATQPHNDNPNKNKSKDRRRGQPKTQDNNKQRKSQHEEEAQPEEEKFFSVGIDRIQLEQDTGKTTTVSRRMLGEDGHGEYHVTESLVDFNRAGCALIEIVFRPDLRSANEAAAVLSTLRDLLRHIGTCDGKMEEGSLRCDLNVSIAPIGADPASEFAEKDNPFQSYLPPGTGHRVEVKNLNSIKQVIASAKYEALRQSSMHMNGTPTARETKTFDVVTGQTVTIRSKEGAVDYRFMPEPDLPPVVLNEAALEGKSLESFLEAFLPELPEVATTRLMEEYGILEDVALVITGDPPAIRMYEVAVETALKSVQDSGSDGENKLLQKIPSMVANWLCNDLYGWVKKSATKQGNEDGNDNADLNHPVSVEYSPVNGEQLGLLIALILEGTVSTTMGKKILSVMYHESPTMKPREIADERGWKMISDPGELRQLCEQVIHDPKNESELERYKKGGKHIRSMKKLFMGKIMKESRGNAHPEILKAVIEAVFEEIAPEIE